MEFVVVLRVTYSKAEILASHEYARPHMEGSHRLHGGFDADGSYISPRSLYRKPAIRAWSAALESRGYNVIDCSQQLKREHFPSVLQQKFLLKLGIEQTLWNTITRSGLVEADGLKVANIIAPDFRPIIEEDISATALAHLNEGLLIAHGLDEGGQGHDLMWLAVRDLLFGAKAYPDPKTPEIVSRPRAPRRMPQIPPEHEDFIVFLISVLMFEVLADNFFRFFNAVVRDPENFHDRRDAAITAANIVDRIREDELLHVGYLSVVISELRSLTFNILGGDQIAGAQLIDPIWRRLMEKHARRNRDSAPDLMKTEVTTALLKLPDGNELVRRFNELRRTYDSCR
jgi:hypothetical protein